ncbi:MAG: hypothetical protein ABIA12_02660 [Candidatus Aenigmatarchaeota archaeon]
MGHGATMDYGWMTPRHVELYRNSGLLIRFLFWLGDSSELMGAPASTHYGPGCGMEPAVSSSEAISVLDEIKKSRDAFKRSHKAFLEEYPECDVGLGTFRRACEYNMANRQRIRNLRQS